MSEIKLDDKIYNPYFLAYIRAKRLNIGDTWKGYEYLNWIQDKHSEFRKQFKLDKELEWIPYTKEQQSLFQKWLNEIADEEALNNWIAGGCLK